MPSPVLAALYEGRRDDAERLADEPDVLEAAALGRLDVLRTHLDGDPDALGVRTPEGFTALHLAAFFGGGAAVRLLLGAGAPADADGENDLRVRPLHSATAARDHDAVRALLEAGADPNVRQHAASRRCWRRCTPTTPR
jgi:ankyrin repeat protein